MLRLALASAARRCKTGPAGARLGAGVAATGQGRRIVDGIVSRRSGSRLARLASSNPTVSCTPLGPASLALFRRRRVGGVVRLLSDGCSDRGEDDAMTSGAKTLSNSKRGGGGGGGYRRSLYRREAATMSARLASLLIHGPSRPIPGVGFDVDGGEEEEDAIERLASSILSASLALAGGADVPIPPPPTPPMSVVLALSGGAVLSSSALATTPGSSSILRECIFPYDRTSFASFVSAAATMPNVSANAARASSSSSLSSSSLSSSSSAKFSFASPIAASLLSDASLRRSMELEGTLRGMLDRCVGVGCAATLVSSPSPSSPSSSSLSSSYEEKRRRSRVYIALSMADGTTEWIDVCLSTVGDDNGMDRNKIDDIDDETTKSNGKGDIGTTTTRNRRRSRQEEDEAASCLLLLSLIRLRYSGFRKFRKAGREVDVASASTASLPEKKATDAVQMAIRDVTSKYILSRDGDSLSERRSGPGDDGLTIGGGKSKNNDNDNGNNAARDDDNLVAVRLAARRVLSSSSAAAVLVPPSSPSPPPPSATTTTAATTTNNTATATTKTDSRPSSSPYQSYSVVVPLAHAILPPDPLIFPGSFNPPHVGHIALANAAVATMERKRKEEWLERERRRERLYGKTIGKGTHDEDDCGGGNGRGGGGEEEGGLTGRGTSFLSTADSSMSTSSSFAENDSDNKSTSPSGAIRDDDDDDGQGPMTTMDSMWSAVEYHNLKQSPPSVLFELSLTNPDKPAMDENEVARRVGLFARCLEPMGGGGKTRGENDDDEEEGKGEENGREGDSNTKTKTTTTTKMPRDWGILLTSAPLFVRKVGVIGQCLAPTRATFDDGSYAKGRRRRMTFVIGTDTMVRIIDPKYYGDSRDSMLEAVREMGDAGVHFVVGGRLEQGKGDGEERRFVTGEEELVSLPEDIQDMFTIIQEKDFRLDLSSTELRKRASSASA